MKKIEREFPLSIDISFHKVFDAYRENLKADSETVKARAQQILALEEAYPILSDGMSTIEEVEAHRPQIDHVLEDLFSPVLPLNEIKIATIPFQEFIFKSTQRYQNIMKVAGPGYELSLTDFDEDQLYIMGCSIILNAYYGYRVDFRRPFYYDIPDTNGIMRHYRVLYNGDFISVEKTENSREITREDVAELIENFDNVEVWKEKFPPNSWKSKGFVIANMYDATTDVALSDFKANLLQMDTKDENFAKDFQTIIRAIFNLPDLTVGYAVYNEDEKTFEQPPAAVNVRSFILKDENNTPCTEALCSVSFDYIFKKHDYYCISDVEKYHSLYPDNIIYKKLHEQQVQSAIITPLVSDNVVFGVMEIVSPNPQELNTVNAQKLQDILPFLVDSVRRSKEKMDNEMELLIQSECTSIHSSVHWKFKQEAKRVLYAQQSGIDASFQEILFENVYPLYGQVDIKGSSTARNEATKLDLVLQLSEVKKIINRIHKMQKLPIYEQMQFRIAQYLDNIADQLEVNTERQVLQFLRTEVDPLFEHLQGQSSAIDKFIRSYYRQLDSDKGFIYEHRKAYDESVMQVNKKMAAVLDKKQERAQAMYPHFYERFKTDGVEHNMYIGESITREENFNKIYLYNLRLWQLQVMCEMENSFYKLKKSLPVPMDVASMVLVFSGSLSLRFRMDEKRFDVDGTYNARYEVVKKRVDKAHIKGTEERITQAGKITIVYSQRSDEKEYLKYIAFLQAKKYLGDELEFLQLEDLQGVTGLKALRINVLYNKGKDTKEYFTYEDLMSELNS